MGLWKGNENQKVCFGTAICQAVLPQKCRWFYCRMMSWYTRPRGLCAARAGCNQLTISNRAVSQVVSQTSLWCRENFRMSAASWIYTWNLFSMRPACRFSSLCQLCRPQVLHYRFLIMIEDCQFRLMGLLPYDMSVLQAREFACPHRMLNIHHWKYWFSIKQWRPMVFHQPLVVWHSGFVPAVDCYMFCLHWPQLAGRQKLVVDTIDLWCRYIHQGLQLSKNEADRMRYVASHCVPHSLCNVDCPNMARLACSSEHNLQHALQPNRHLTYLQNHFSRFWISLRDHDLCWICAGIEILTEFCSRRNWS